MKKDRKAKRLKRKNNYTYVKLDPLMCAKYNRLERDRLRKFERDLLSNFIYEEENIKNNNNKSVKTLTRSKIL